MLFVSRSSSRESKLVPFKRIIIDVCAGRKKVRKFFFNEGERDRENEWT